MRRIPQLDSVRGLAVLLVLLHNADKYEYTGPIARFGWMGVDLFFVLSGFLITSILLNSKMTKDYFRNFYARRCLRIWPLYYCALLFMFIAVPLLRPAEAGRIFEPRSMPYWSYFVYLQNFLVPRITGASGLLAVTWSLAVEEQFYLVWPIVVRVFSETQLRTVVVSILLVSPLLRFGLIQRHVDVYPNTFCRLDGLMAGALLALLFRSKTFSQKKYVLTAWIVMLLALFAALATAQGARWAVFSFTALASVAFVYIALCSNQRWVQQALRNRFLLYTGTISYGIYLLQKIAPDVMQSLRMEQYSLLVLPVTIVMTFALAALSWMLLEKPCLRLRRFFVNEETTKGPMVKRQPDVYAIVS